VAAYLAGATTLALASKQSIHRTTVLALLERHQISRRRRGLTPDRIEQAVSSSALGCSCASIGRELRANPETVRQALLKAGMAMRRPGRPSAKREPCATSIGHTGLLRAAGRTAYPPCSSPQCSAGRVDSAALPIGWTASARWCPQPLGPHGGRRHAIGHPPSGSPGWSAEFDAPSCHRRRGSCSPDRR
jgi:hypothetical protein